MQRWRIEDGGGFLLYCMVHVPAVGSVIFALGYYAGIYLNGFPRYSMDQLPAMLIFIPLFAALAVPFGILICALPGVLGGCALLLLSHFRAPTTLELLAGAALAAGLPVLLFSGGGNGPAPLVSAAIGVASALAVSRRAKRRGIIVPYDPAASAPSSAPA